MFQSMNASQYVFNRVQTVDETTKSTVGATDLGTYYRACSYTTDFIQIRSMDPYNIQTYNHNVVRVRSAVFNNQLFYNLYDYNISINRRTK